MRAFTYIVVLNGLVIDYLFQNLKSMKKIILTALIVACSSTIIVAQQRENRYRRNNRDIRNTESNNYQPIKPPTRVQETFRRENPNAENARWIQANNEWNVTYSDRQHNNHNAQAYYDKNGRHIDSHIAWDRNQVPAAVDNRVYSRYHTRDYKVYRIERHNNTSLFQLILNIAGKPKTIYTDERGNEVRYKDRH